MMGETNSSAEEMSKKIKVAAVQMQAAPYRVSENIQKAEGLVEQAASEGAQVVVLPELFNTGYCYELKNFEVGETLSGRTVCWMRNLTKKLNVYMAGAIIERDGGALYDTLVFASPQGRVVSYRKRWLALQEKCFFSKGDDPLLIDTPLGRIGIGICADMFDQKVWERFRNKVHLIIISSAWPDLTTGGFLFSKSGVNSQISRMPEVLPKRLASVLGVPVVYANLAGPFHSPLPLLYPYRVTSRFVGHSAVYDGGGIEAWKIKDEEGIAVGEVSIQPSPAAGNGNAGRYKVEWGVKFMARLDRVLLTFPCWLYKRLKRPRQGGKIWKKLQQSS